MTSVQTARRIEFLEAVRGIAAVLVVFHHVMVNISVEYRWFGHTFFDLGRIGVVAFFLVSGYVIPLSLHNQTQKTFWVRRFFRLFPVYWVAFAVYLAAAHGAVPDAPLWVWGMNLGMLNGLIGLVSILPPAWTLSIELLFYLQTSVAKALRMEDRAIHAGWVWLGLFLALCAASAVLDKDLPVTLPLLMFCAALGHALHLRDSAGNTAWKYLIGAGLILGPVGTFVRGSDGEWAPVTYSASFVLGVALFLAFYAARHMPTPKTLVWLGGISYALYLFHISVTHFLFRTLGLDGFPYFIAAVGASILIAAVAHRWLEQPSIGLGRRLTTTAKHSAQASPALTR